MKTRNLLKICALSALLFTVSCNNDNTAELENSTAKLN